MNVLTIPRGIITKDDLVVVPRREYESLLVSQERLGDIDLAVHEGLQEYKRGKCAGPFSATEAKKFLKGRRSQ